MLIRAQGIRESLKAIARKTNILPGRRKVCGKTLGKAKGKPEVEEKVMGERIIGKVRTK